MGLGPGNQNLKGQQICSITYRYSHLILGLMICSNILIGKVQGGSGKRHQTENLNALYSANHESEKKTKS